MSPRQLLEKLEALGGIDEKILGKIRKEIQNPEKNVKPKAVLSYLVKKGQLTPKQAKNLLKETPAPAKPPTADEIQVVEPNEPAEKDYDTNDLMGLEPESVVEPVVEPTVEPIVEVEPVLEVEPTIDPGATIMDDGLLASDSPDEVVVVQPSVEAPIDHQEPELQETMPSTGIAEPGGAFDSQQVYADQPAGSKVHSFIGKRNQKDQWNTCLLYTSPSPRDATLSRMPSSA